MKNINYAFKRIIILVVCKKMYSYYAGDNERNDYDKMGKDPNQKDAKENQLKKAPSADFNHQILKRKHISQLELEKAKREAE